MKEEKLIPLSLSKLITAVSGLSWQSEAGKNSSWRCENYLHSCLAHCLRIRCATQLSLFLTNVVTSKVWQSKERPTSSYSFTGRERDKKKAARHLHLESVKCKTLGL